MPSDGLIYPPLCVIDCHNCLIPVDLDDKGSRQYTVLIPSGAIQDLGAQPFGGEQTLALVGRVRGRVRDMVRETVQGHG